MEDILLINKPAGITSFDVIRQLRRKLSITKIGHAGTLDPLATGLMILGVGAGTKKLTSLVKLDKEYIAEVLIGEKRSTGDMEGIVLASVEQVTLTHDDIVAQAQSMVGVLELPVSAYSAIKKDGVPMYKRARKAEREGVLVEDVPARAMRVDEVEVLHVEPEVSSSQSYAAPRVIIKIRFKVGSGTYIRSLAEELGSRLDYPATLKSLHRTQIGDYRIEDATHLEDISE